MKDTEKRAAAKAFADYWQNRGDEKRPLHKEGAFSDLSVYFVFSFGGYPYK